VTVSGVSWNAVLQPGHSTDSVGFCAQLWCRLDVPDRIAAHSEQN
jgi:hypothetical protein